MPPRAMRVIRWVPLLVNMKVLHVFNTYYPDTHGGTEQFIHQLAHQTQLMGVDNTVFTLSKTPSDKAIMVKGVRVVQAPQTGHHFSMPWSWSGFWVFRRLIQECDLIHFHHPWPYADFLYLLFGRKKPAVLTYHLDLVRAKWVMMLYRPLMRLFFKHIQAVVCTSEAYIHSSPYLKSFIDKTTAIPIGIDEASYPQVSVDRRQYWRDCLRSDFALFMGAFRYYKGLPDLIQACIGSSIRLVILGSGPLEHQIKTLVKELQLEERIQFVGAVDDEDKMAILSLARVVVLPSSSRAEAFGITLLEGMMAAKPLISTELRTGTSWVNQDQITGWVVPANNPQQLKNALQFFLNHPLDATEMGRAGRQRFENLFTAKKMGLSYCALYKRVLAQ